VRVYSEGFFSLPLTPKECLSTEGRERKKERKKKIFYSLFLRPYLRLKDDQTEGQKKMIVSAVATTTNMGVTIAKYAIATNLGVFRSENPEAHVTMEDTTVVQHKTTLATTISSSFFVLPPK